MNENLKMRIIIVGVNSNNEDILSGSIPSTGNEGAEILEEGAPCPPICGVTGPLNE